MENKKEKARFKSKALISGSEETWQWTITCSVKGNGAFNAKGLIRTIDIKRRKIKDSLKEAIRDKDRKWAKDNIPSGILWNTEKHHDWENGARLYFLTKKEHILRHRRKNNG